MTKLRRETHTTLSDAAALRIRAAWLYYNEGLTQKDVADRLGISRSTVIRMLEEARKRAEVQIWISDGVSARGTMDGVSKFQSPPVRVPGT